tara:strand:- start:1566 stop:3038 length:1473 start_codon:yes stop_codon:yes gene_type:complete
MGMSMGLSLVQSERQELSLPTTNWSFVDAWYREEGEGCLLPRARIEGFNDLDIDAKLRQVDEANEVFRYDYDETEGRYYRFELRRNRNLSVEDVVTEITKEEFVRATTIIKNAGQVERIARSVPYTEIRQDLMDHIESEGCTLDDIVVVGVDRGGRLPTLIVKEALEAERVHYLKVDQGRGFLDSPRLSNFSLSGTFRGKYVLFVDSTVDSGRQIDALRSSFDGTSIRSKNLGHVGWAVVGSNEYGETLDDHVQIDWGLDPDEAFEDDPNLMGVDYGFNHHTIKANPTKMSSDIRTRMLAVPRGVVLDVSGLFEADGSVKAVKRKVPSGVPTLLVIGDGQDVTIDGGVIDYIALGLENGYHVIAGTDGGNPGEILGTVDVYDNRGVTLIQPTYMQGRGRTSGFDVEYLGDTKGDFRQGLVERADAILAIGGNEGTFDEIQRGLGQGIPTFVTRNLGNAGVWANDLEGDPNLILTDTIEGSVDSLRTYSGL